MTYFSPNWGKEEQRKAHQKYQEKHPDKVKKSRDKWNKNNLERRKAFISLWDHRQKGIPVFVSSKEVAELLKRAKYCPACGVEMKYGNGTACGESPSIDRRDNSPILNIKTINIICHRCNSKKGNKLDILILGHAAKDYEENQKAKAKISKAEREAMWNYLASVIPQSTSVEQEKRRELIKTIILGKDIEED